MRISERMRYDVVQQRVNNTKEANANSLERLSTQKDVRKLSDDPLRAVDVIKGRDVIRGLSQFQRNVEFSRGILEASESSLERISNALIRAKELAIGMANDTHNAETRRLTSREVKEIMEEIVQTANTNFNGRYIFSGFRSQSPALTHDGEYLGDDGSLFLQVSPDDFRQVNISGRKIFEPTQEEAESGHFGLVQTINLLYDGLSNNTIDKIQRAMTELDYQLEKTQSSRATVGSLAGSLDAALSRLESEAITSKTKLSKAEETDIFDATSEFRKTEAALQSTLLASTKLLQPSLLNFLQ